MAEFTKPPPYPLNSLAKVIAYYMALGMASGQQLVLQNAKKDDADGKIKSVAIRCSCFQKPKEGTKGTGCQFKLFVKLPQDNPLHSVEVEIVRFVMISE